MCAAHRLPFGGGAKRIPESLQGNKHCLSHKAVETQRQQALSWPRRQWQHKATCSVLATKAVATQRQQAVSWPRRQWKRKGKDSFFTGRPASNRAAGDGPATVPAIQLPSLSRSAFLAEDLFVARGGCSA